LKFFNFFLIFYFIKRKIPVSNFASNLGEMLQTVNLGDQVWWYMPVTSALRRGRLENSKFKASLGYIVSSRPP
jgi:hypothetical protein